MENQNYASILCERITNLRKDNGLTQEALASKLGISFQAVSKWENGLSCPDIALLPELADIFGVSIDELFGRAPKAAASAPAPEGEEQEAYQSSSEDFSFLPWEDDGKLRAAAFIGRRLVAKPTHDSKKFEFRYIGKALDVTSYLNVTIEGDVQGDVDAGNSVTCGDVGGSVDAGSSVTCGDVNGDIDAGGHVECGNVDGDVDAGGSVTVEGDVHGDIHSGGDVRCENVSGDVECAGDVTVEGSVEGNVHAEGKLIIKGKAARE